MANHSPYHSFYTSSAWRKLRLRKLNDKPLCEHCSLQGVVTPGTDIDHIISIAIDESLALAYNNLQTLCKSCHSKKTKKASLSTVEVDRLANRLKGLLK